MKNKKQKKNNIKQSILILLLIAILLIASTYAWFTANTNVEISTLNVKVEAANGLQISADGTNWKTILQNTDIDPDNVTTTYESNVNQIPTIMEPTSTVGTMTEAGQMEMFAGTVTSDKNGAWVLSSKKLTDTKGKGDTAGKYIVFDTFLKVDEDMELSLEADSGVTVKEGGTDKGLQNAARVAFVELGHTASGSDLTTIQGLNTGTSSKVHIWEPNYNRHTSTGITNAKDNYGKTVTDNSTTADDYYGVKAVIPSDSPVALASKDSNYFSAVTPEYKTKDTGEKVSMLTLEAGITKVRIYMWVEGQDVDCENTASGTDISYTVKFSIPSTTSGT